MANYTLITKGDQLDAVYTLLGYVRVVGLDTETTGLSPLTARLRLVQITIGDRVFILDMYRLTGDAGAWSFLAFLLEHRDIVKVVHNAKFDAKFFIYELGIIPVSLFDTFLGSQIIGGGDLLTHHGLEDVARVYLGIRLDKTEQSGDWSGNELSESQLEYAAKDSRVLVPIHDRMVRHFIMDDLTRCAWLEFNCIIPLAEMELNGFPMDRERWSEKIKRDVVKRDQSHAELLELLKPGINWLTKNPDRGPRPVKPKKPDHPTRSNKGRERANQVGLEAALNEYSHHLAFYEERLREYEGQLEEWSNIPNEVGGLINLNSHPQVKQALTNITGLDWFTLTTNDAVLMRYAKDFPVVSALQNYRGDEKVVTSYGENWLEALDPDGRIRADFKQIGAEKTGRMSCNNPVNLQNPPANEETRSCFVAPNGRKLVIADYSQIELRIAADFSADEAMCASFVKGEDLHQNTANDLNVPRSFAKRLNFGIPYGIGPTKFAAQAGISFEEGKNIIGRHRQKYVGLHQWLDSADAQAREQRFARTMSGRIMRFSADDAGDYKELRKVLSAVGRNGKNGPIQGTSADIIKRAARLVYDALRGSSAKLVNIVHDEIVVEVDEGEAEWAAEVVQSKMVEAGGEFVTRVPVPVEAKVSEVWLK